MGNTIPNSVNSEVQQPAPQVEKASTATITAVQRPTQIDTASDTKANEKSGPNVDDLVKTLRAQYGLPVRCTWFRQGLAMMEVQTCRYRRDATITSAWVYDCDQKTWCTASAKCRDGRRDVIELIVALLCRHKEQEKDIRHGTTDKLYIKEVVTAVRVMFGLPIECVCTKQHAVIDIMWPTGKRAVGLFFSLSGHRWRLGSCFWENCPYDCIVPRSTGAGDASQETNIRHLDNNW
jgi:hypothetical protein